MFLDSNQQGREGGREKAGGKTKPTPFKTHEPRANFQRIVTQKIIMIKQFLQEEEGQTLVEYGLLISLIAIVVIGVLTVLGRKVSNTFNGAANSMNAAT